MTMNTQTNFSCGQTGLSAQSFYSFRVTQPRRMRRELWFRIAVKVTAFTAGCLIALAFGLYDNSASAAPSAQISHPQAVQDRGYGF